MCHEKSSTKKVALFEKSPFSRGTRFHPCSLSQTLGMGTNLSAVSAKAAFEGCDGAISQGTQVVAPHVVAIIPQLTGWQVGLRVRWWVNQFSRSLYKMNVRSYKFTINARLHNCSSWVFVWDLRIFRLVSWNLQISVPLQERLTLQLEIEKHCRSCSEVSSPYDQRTCYVTQSGIFTLCCLQMLQTI